ncbi:DUF4440 domain-containing protein [Streptomyces virginiae]|uniref:DUF4440 domain-containing protein n=1 Tax=Streptomyces virginiae TaxID=1961 RepID=UPI0036BB48F7
MRAARDEDDLAARLREPSADGGAHGARADDDVPHADEPGTPRRSGRPRGRSPVPAALPDLEGGAEDGPRYEPAGMTGVELAPGAVHLTYETTIDGRRARRSSIWRRAADGSGWRMYYHQATPVPGA